LDFDSHGVLLFELESETAGFDAKREAVRD
jgi:hypothetical protein